MRLHRCYIGRYRVLRQLQIDFTPHQNQTPVTGGDPVALDFLVGPNGAGKSTLLQALAEIFARLANPQQKIDFPFMVNYDHQESSETRKILITNCDWEHKDHHAGDLRIVVDDQPLVWSEGLRERYLPKRIAVITTGRETEWTRLLAASSREPRTQQALNSQQLSREAMEARALSELPGVLTSLTADAPSETGNPVTLIPAETLPLVTLCALLTEFNEKGSLNNLTEIFAETRITQVCGFTLTFRLNEGVTLAADRRRIEELQPIAKRVVQTGSDRRLYFDLTVEPQNVTSQLFAKLGKAFDIYSFLHRLSASPTAAERTFQSVDIFVRRGISEDEQRRRRESDRPELPPSLQLLSQLSDGERSFLGRMSVFSMLSDQPSLVLLDEPEVHFNDYWKRQIVFYLHNALQQQKSHALITTHSSITLTDVARRDILILYRENTHTEKSDNPSINTLAADPSDIMVHVFQSPHATGKHAVRRVQEIERRINEGRTAQGLSPNDRQAATDLLDQLGPGYWRYQLRRAIYQSSQDAA